MNFTNKIDSSMIQNNRKKIQKKITIGSMNQGGLKAVVWTDVLQSASMFGALILVAVKGSIDLGGADVVFGNALATNRIEAPK